MKTNSILTVVTLLFISCTETEEKRTKDHYAIVNDSLTIKLEQVYAEKAIPGFSVAIVNENGIIYSEGFGTTDLDGEKKYTANTLQRIASISKTVLGIALLKAQEMGKLSVEDPIDKYLPFEVKNPNFPEKPILIKHLAYHSSSIRDTRNVFENSYILINDTAESKGGILPFFNEAGSKIGLEEFLVNTLSKEGKWYGDDSFFEFEPGEQRRYSNLGAGVCEYILEKVTGQDYAAFTEEVVFNPLKMKTSLWEYQIVGNGTRLYLNDSTAVAEYEGFNLADGGLTTSVNELSLFLSELINAYSGKGTLLAQESYQLFFDTQQFPEQMSQPGIFVEARPRAFGFEEPLMGHMGSDPGFLTAMYFNTESGLGKIMFLNIEPRTQQIRDQIGEIWKALMDHETRVKEIDASI